jgi:hypothetical protein
MDFSRIALYYTLDVISDLAFGKQFENIERNEDVIQYIDTFKGARVAGVLTQVFPWIVQLGKYPFFRRFAHNEKDKFGFGRIMGYAYRSPRFFLLIPINPELQKRGSPSDSVPTRKLKIICLDHSSNTVSHKKS